MKAENVNKGRRFLLISLKGVQILGNTRLACREGTHTLLYDPITIGYNLITVRRDLLIQHSTLQNSISKAEPRYG